MPTLTVIAGPNGAAKSTIARLTDFEGRDRLLDPDAIARRINPFNPSVAALPAGREALRRTAEYLEQRLSFAVETTLAGHGKLDLFREAKSRGYEVHLLFVGLDSPEHASAGFGSLARARQHGPSEGGMKKESAARRGGDMRKEYDLSKLAGGVRGKYYRQATAATNLVLIEPDLANMFPDSESVNRALRVLAEAAQTASGSKRRRSR